jgi:hypothetical protein
MPYLAHSFVDGKYLRKVCETANVPLADPLRIVNEIVFSNDIQSWGGAYSHARNVSLGRLTYYDGRPDDDADISDNLRKYWDSIELLPDRLYR